MGNQHPVERRIGKVVRRARRAKGIGITAMSRTLAMSKQNVSKLERGEHGWSVARLIQVSEALRTSPVAIIDEACALAEHRFDAHPLSAPFAQPDPAGAGG